jgi:hypothetical protein
MYRRLASLVLVALVLALPGAGTAVPLLQREPIEAAIEAAREHQEALERLLALQQADLARAESDVLRRRDLAAQDLIARREVTEAEERAAWLARAVDETRGEIARADALLTEARAALTASAALPPPGVERQAPDHIAFGGHGGWSLARLPALAQFFSERFGRRLPVSAYGQTRTHDQLGFDHRHAVDVALHPDTTEGRALVAWLKAEGVPFIAFRAAAPGTSTGAHVHIGEPSPRIPTAPPPPRSVTK